jgi:putative membrane protein
VGGRDVRRKLKEGSPHVNRWKIGVAVGLLLGLLITVGVILHVGAAELWAAVRRVGLDGFLVFSLYSLAGFLPLGWAWWAVAPGSGSRRWLLFPWGRLVRESASDVLPFSQVGGLVVGLRAVQGQGVAEPLAVASQIVDLTTEMAAQLVYTLFGLAILAAVLSHATGAQELIWTTVLAIVGGAVMLCAFVTLQARGLDLVGAIAGRWLKDTRERAQAIKAVLADIYARRGRLAAGVGWHAVGWLWSGAGAWLCLAFMGVHVELWKVLALESLIAAVKSVAFLTPGALGFQEGAYALVAPLFGITPEAALAVSLLRRAKDLLLGVPAMLAWQAGELSAKSAPVATSVPSPLAGEGVAEGDG